MINRTYRAEIRLSIDFTDDDCRSDGVDPDQYADQLTRDLIAALEYRMSHPFNCYLDDITEPDPGNT